MCQTLVIVGIRRWRIFSFHYPCSADFLWILLLAGPSDLTLLMQLCFTFCCCCCCCSVAKSCPTLCNPMDCSMPGFPVPSPRVCSDSCPLSWWCYLTISSFAALFSFCLQSFPASGSFSMSQLFASGCQSIGTSASASVNIDEYSELISFRIHCLDLLAVQGTSPTPQFKSINSLALSLLYGPILTSIHDYWKNVVSCSRGHW